MGLLRDPVASNSHHSWNNLATRYGRFCVQKRTEEGLNKNAKLRHRLFYTAEDLFPFRIIYSTYPSDFSDALPASLPTSAAVLYPSRSTAEGGSSVTGLSSSVGYVSRGASSSPVTTFTGVAASARTPSMESEEVGLVDSLLNWWSGQGGNKSSSSGSVDSGSTTAASWPTSSTNFFSFFPFSSSSVGLRERYTVATSMQLSGILEAWGLLLEAWEPEEAELNVLSFASPAMASPTSTHIPDSNNNSGEGGRVPFVQRWRRTYGRVGVLCAAAGMDRSAMTGPDAATPPSSSFFNESATINTSASVLSPLGASASASRSRRSGGADDAALAKSATRSFASRHHVHISDEYYSADSPAPLALAHFFDVLLIRVVDLFLWRDPQLTACCLGILVSIYGHSAWASALCYLAGERLSSSSSPYCYAMYRSADNNSNSHFGPYAAFLQGWVSAERVWWGAPVFMISVLTYPWTGEQQRRVVTLTDREHLRSVDHALRWLSATDNAEATIETTAEQEGGEYGAATAATAMVVVVDVAKQVFKVLRANRLPISVLLLFNVIGAFSSWEAILVLFLWPMLIVSVGLAGVVAAVECLQN